MNFQRISLYTLLCLFLMTACKNAPNAAPSNNDTDYVDDEGYDADYREPYPEYCLLGDLQDVDPYAIKKHDGTLEIKGNHRADVNDVKITSFSASLSDYDKLEEAGIKRIVLDVKVGYGEPKATKGSFVLEPFATLSTESIPLPQIMVFLNDFDESSSFEAVMRPDVEPIKKSPFSTPETYPSYIIEAASLNITHIEDMKLDEDEKDEQKMQAGMGMITGKQYVKGTVSFTIKKFGDKGADFGPTTFTFAAVNDWAYFPKLEK